MLNNRFGRTLKVCLAFSALCAFSALAQDRGTIRGIVNDLGGAAVPGAAITVKNVNTGLTQSTRTGGDGIYTFYTCLLVLIP